MERNLSTIAVTRVFCSSMIIPWKNSTFNAGNNRNSRSNAAKCFVWPSLSYFTCVWIIRSPARYEYLSRAVIERGDKNKCDTTRTFFFSPAQNDSNTVYVPYVILMYEPIIKRPKISCSQVIDTILPQQRAMCIVAQLYVQFNYIPNNRNIQTLFHFVY